MIRISGLHGTLTMERVVEKGTYGKTNYFFSHYLWSLMTFEINQYKNKLHT